MGVSPCDRPESTYSRTSQCIAQAGILENENAGVLIREDGDSITFALDRSIGTGGLRCTLCIPKVNVRRIRRFRA